MDGIDAKITTIGQIQGCVIVSVYADAPPTTGLTKMSVNVSATEDVLMGTQLTKSVDAYVTRSVQLVTSLILANVTVFVTSDVHIITN